MADPLARPFRPTRSPASTRPALPVRPEPVAAAGLDLLFPAAGSRTGETVVIE